MKKSILTCLMLAAATVAQADVIDFEDLGIAVGTQLNPAGGVGIVTGGFTYTPGPNNASGLDDLHIGNAVNFFPSNGTTIGVTHDDVVLAKVGGGAFSINSFDFAGWPTNAEVPFRVRGDYLLGGSIFQSFTPDGLVDGPGGVTDFQTFFFDPGWTGLSSVTWNHTGAGTAQGIFGLDNIVVNQENPVPEPASVLLLGSAGVLALAAARRRQKQNTKIA